MNAIVLGSLLGVYFNAVLICFFVNLVRQNGLVLNPVKSAKLIWPLLRSMLLGFAPAAIFISLIQQLIQSPNIVTVVIFSLGALVSAILLHRFLLSEVDNPRKWNVAIAILACAMILLLWAPFNSF